MTREEEYFKQASDYIKENHSPSDVSDFQAAMNVAVLKAYMAGAKWADDNQNKQLVNIDKACAWLEENFIDECGSLAAGIGTIHFNTKPAVEAFRKAMEE